MIILIFGVSNVGKTTTGKMLADRLGYDFYDLDEEVKRYYHTTLEEFVRTGTVNSRDKKRGVVINEIMSNSSDKVLVISPMSYSVNFNNHIDREDVFSIELQDSAEHIFNRLVFSDENDKIYFDEEYKQDYKEYLISDIKEDISWYKRSFLRVKNKLYINDEPVNMVVNRIIEEYKLIKNQIE